MDKIRKVFDDKNINIQLKIRSLLLGIQIDMKELLDDKKLSNTHILQLLRLEEKIKMLQNLIIDENLHINPKVLQKIKHPLFID